MKLIVGLGNPEKKYENTFHNLGFMGVDKTALEFNVEFNKTKCKALIAETKIGNEKILLAKPQTYMNASGESVAELLSYFKIDLKDLIVIYDDYDLPMGSLRIRENGSAGTHNGMRNILKMLGTGDFARIRIGFKPTTPTQVPLLDMVLSGIKPQDKALFDEMTTIAKNASVDFAKGLTVQQIMQKYNTKKDN